LSGFQFNALDGMSSFEVMVGIVAGEWRYFFSAVGFNLPNETTACDYAATRLPSFTLTI
jgi:hypothetical protein